MEIKTVFYDMDNTLLEMSEHLVGQKSGRVKIYGALKNVSLNQIMEKLHTKGLFSQFKPIYRSQPAVRNILKKGYEVGIISQPMINDYCVPEKNKTLKKYFPEIDMTKVTYTFQKHLLAGYGRILVDDHTEHLEKWEKMGGIAVCFTRGYNKNWKGLRIKKHSELLGIIKQIEEGVI